MDFIQYMCTSCGKLTKTISDSVSITQTYDIQTIIRICSWMQKMQKNAQDVPAYPAYHCPSTKTLTLTPPGMTSSIIPSAVVKDYLNLVYLTSTRKLAAAIPNIDLLNVQRYIAFLNFQPLQ